MAFGPHYLRFASFQSVLF